MPSLTRACDTGHPHPRSRECLDGRVLAAAGDEDAVRWRAGERLEHVFEARCDQLRARSQADRLAADAGDVTLTYPELDGRANRLARFLVRRGGRPGDRIGLLFDEAIDGYTAMLAVLKAHAAYVPLDAAFPGDRLAFIAADASLRLVLTHSRLAHQAESLAAATEVQQLAVLPMLPSGKTDRKQLPPPRGERRLAARGDYVAPAEGIERDLAELLAGVLRVERVSADSHFFDDLAADSLLMARFNAAIRDRGDLPAVSMKDVYLHPTIRRLAAALPAGPAPGAAGGLARPADGPR